MRESEWVYVCSRDTIVDGMKKESNLRETRKKENMNKNIECKWGLFFIFLVSEHELKIMFAALFLTSIHTALSTKEKEANERKSCWVENVHKSLQQYIYRYIYIYKVCNIETLLSTFTIAFKWVSERMSEWTSRGIKIVRGLQLWTVEREYQRESFEQVHAIQYNKCQPRMK